MKNEERRTKIVRTKKRKGQNQQHALPLYNTVSLAPAPAAAAAAAKKEMNFLFSS